MNEIVLPEEYNYIGAFLTLRCNLNCSYCINKYDEFSPVVEMSGKDWIKGLARIKTRLDLPITLQGGEPTLHPDFYDIVDYTRFIYAKHLDLLTNGLFDNRDFMTKIPAITFKRRAKYASIRVSYHLKTPAKELVARVYELLRNGYEIGIWGLDNNKLENAQMKKYCEKLGIDFREKEYLNAETGTYKYPDAVTKNKRQKVECKTSELLIGPSGHIFRCHADLYAHRNSIAHILDKDVNLPGYVSCSNYGFCNPCDFKEKFDRFQVPGHTSVEVKFFDKKRPE